MHSNPSVAIAMAGDSVAGTGDPPPSQLIPGLPDDLALQIIARVPVHHHRTLSLVSKTWLSLLRSPFIFSIRSLLGCSQHLLFLNLRLPNSSCWFSLLHPSLSLSPLPPNPSPAVGSAVAVAGHRIFLLGGCTHDLPTPEVWSLDARFSRWEPVHRMRVAREFAAAGVIAGKIYVMGGCVVDSWAKSTNWAEVFDPDLGFWKAVPSPVEVRVKWMHASAVIGGKIYAMADRGGVVLDPAAEAWEGVLPELDFGWRGRAAVVGGVLYCYDYLGKIRGFDVEEGVWKELKGVEKGLPRFLCGATMANFGERLVVVWEGKGKRKEMEIMCAELEVRKDSDGGLQGSIVWMNSILSVPTASAIMHCVAVEL